MLEASSVINCKAEYNFYKTVREVCDGELVDMSSDLQQWVCEAHSLLRIDDP